MKWNVTITARITKTIQVEADNEEMAYHMAHEEFTTASDGGEERYEQETDSCEPAETVAA